VKHAASVRPEPGSNSPLKNKPHTPRHARKREPHPLTDNTLTINRQKLLSTKETTNTTKAMLTGHNKLIRRL
ncbi:hypothetical protein, partial [Nocardioides campestrisoli]|uniref:hypothetical protein n=1 Tax=Nocardioides campestrisoli TaxID=2736757 RepID=UPI001C636A04